MFGKKQQDDKLPVDPRENPLVRTASGNGDMEQRTRTYCRLESIRWAVENKRISEHPDEREGAKR